MTESLHYETPENVRIEYRPAGLGTRFIAWFLDGIILYVGMFVVFLLLTLVAAALAKIFEHWFEQIGKMLQEAGGGDPEVVAFYFMGIGLLIFSLGNFVYFSLCEILMRGQTPGKRACKIRVVKVEGFVLEPSGVLLRNILRIVDNIPIMWLVPLLNKRSQRLGDLAAGTVVISEEPTELSPVRNELSERNAAEARFRFDYGKLAALKPTDFEAVEQLLNRWEKLTEEQRRMFVDRLLGALARKMGIEPPPAADRLAFLEDLLAAEFRRQDRRLR